MLHFADKESDILALMPLFEASSKCLVIADKTAYRHHQQLLESLLDNTAIEYHLILLSGNEQAKSLNTVKKIWKQFHTLGADRKSLVLTFGGGTICDIGGFAAACYMRGLETIHFPTSLLAMVDASIGGKTGINFENAKNLIGTFSPAKGVIISPLTLESLPKSELSNGIAEIIKAAVISDDNLFYFLEDQMSSILELEPLAIHHIVEQAIKVKMAIVKRDTYEKKERAILNYGHTFGHAIEMTTPYSHGEAVAIGMCCAAIAGEKLRLTNSDFTTRQEKLCHLAGLPTKLPENLSDDELLTAMKSDKKRAFQKFSLIVPEKIGKVIIATSIEESFLRDVIQEKRKRDRQRD